MIVQGWSVANGNNSYKKNPKITKHPEMVGVKNGEKLMTVRFDETDNDDPYAELNRRVQKLKYQELFDEPSTFEDEEDV